MQREPAPRYESMQGRLMPLGAALGLVEREMATQPAFGGFVIHHDGSCRRWLERAR